MKILFIFFKLFFPIFIFFYHSSFVYATDVTYHFSIKSNPSDPFNQSVADSQGTIYIGGIFNIYKYSKSGNYISTFNFFDNYNDTVWGMAIDKNDNLYIAGYNSIYKFSKNYALLLKFGQAGPNYGQFQSVDVALDSLGNIYVSDQFSSRIQKFDPNGRFLLSFGRYGTRDNEFVMVRQITIDKSNNIYVLDGEPYGGAKAVKKFTSSGTFLLKWDKQLSGLPWMTEPVLFEQNGVSAAPNGQIITIAGPHFQRFSSNGLPLEYIELLEGCQSGTAGDIWIDKNGKIYVADGHGVHVYSWGLGSTPSPPINQAINSLMPMLNLLLQE